MQQKRIPRPSLDGGLLSVRLVVACLAAVALARAQSNTPDKRAALCKDVRKLVSSADPILLDADAVSTIDGGIQHVLDCLPQRAAIQFSLAELKPSDTLHIKRAVSIEGLGTSIPCLDGSTQPIVDVRSDDVLLAGFSFTGCNLSSTSGLVQVKGSQNVTLRDMVFENNANSVGPSCVSAVKSTMQLQNITALNNRGVHGGAMSFVEASEIAIVDSVFESNHADEQGGAIHMHNSNLDLSNSRFSENLAFDDGGAISAEGDLGSEVDMRDVEFAGNQAYGEYKNDSNWRAGGGIAFVGSKLTATIVGGTFVNNSAVNDGGAISAFNGTKVFIQDGDFLENVAFQGGSIYVQSSLPNVTHLELDGCNFTRNRVEGSFEGLLPLGGAISMSRNGTEAALKNCTFMENTAATIGGAMFVSQTKKLKILASQFLRNGVGHISLPTASKGSSVETDDATVFTAGGGVFVSRVPQVSIAETTFVENRAKIGGGLYVDSDSLGDAFLKISKSKFVGNTATSATGGAVALLGQNLKCSLKKSVFEENQAGGDGGAVFTAGIASLELSGCSFEGNFCGVPLSQRQPRLPSQGSSVAKNDGGAVLVFRVPQVSIVEATFIKNRASRGGGLVVNGGDLDTTVLDISGSVFAENTATSDTGGAVALSGQKLKCSVGKTVFKENQAGATGGAVFTSGIASLELSGCSFEGNFCGVPLSPRKSPAKDSETGTRNLDRGTTLGGALVLWQVPATVIINCSFVRNEAGSGGSMLAVGDDEESSLLRIESSVFSRNDAAKDGGAMFVGGEGLEASISGATFENNTSGEAGGGIHILQSILVIDKTQFRDNFSKVGGAIHLLSANGRIAKSVFTGNVAEDNGGAVAAFGPDGVSLRVDSLVFSDNAAGLDGGAVHLFRTGSSIKRSKFERNKAGNNGGAIDGASVEIDASQCLFENNTSSEDGGGLSMMDSIVLIKSTDFRANVAERGGAAFVFSSKNGTTVSIERSEFTGNVGSVSGGAIYSAHVVTRSILTVNRTLIFDEDRPLVESLTEDNFSGDISFEENSFLKTRDVEFKGNHAGTDGGALYFAGLNVEMEGDLFHNNSAGGSGGAVFLIELAGSVPNVTIESGSFVANQGTLGGAIFLQNRDLNISHCDFRSNIARNGGGALHCEDLALSFIVAHKDSLITVHSSDFSANKAGASHQGKEDIELTSVDGKGGAVLMSGLGLVSEFKTCTFSSNAAGSGGAVHVEDVKQLNLTNSDFRRGSALTGGALTVRSAGKTLAAINVSFVGNAARWGGAISLGSSGGIIFDGLSEGPDSLTQARFLENIATRGGGAIDLKERLLLCESCVFDSNSVGDDGDEFGSGGAIRAQSAANLTLASSTIMGCTATQSGGGLSLEDAIFFGENVAIVNNTAVNDGGGLAVHFPADIPWKCSSCSINGNKAGRGGGISISASKALLRNCQAMEASSSVRSEHERFEQIADCEHSLDDPESLGHRVVLDNTTFKANRAQDSGSHIFLSDFKSDICCDGRCWNVASELDEGLQKCGLGETSPGAGRELPSLGTLFESVLVLPDSVTSHPSGRELPLINITLLDSFGQIAVDNVTLRVEVATPGGELFGNPATSEGVLMSGDVTLTGIVMRALPDKYNLSIQLTSEDGKRTVLKRVLVEIRECEVGEVSQEEGFRCDKCPTDFFSFDVTDDTCTPCPVEKARCAGGRLAPLDGFWHSHPQSPQLHECLSAEACTFPNRTEVLFASNSTSSQGHPQCAKGYRDVLCGSCETSHGRRRFLCSECRGGVPAGLGIGVVMLALAVLSLIYVKSAAKYSEGVLGTQSGVSSASHAAPSGSQGRMVDQDMQGQHRNSPHGKRRSSNIFKILVNFFQVTGSAAAINVNWTEGMLMLFTTSDLASGVGDSSSFFSLECTFSSGKNGLPRSIQTSIFLAILPLIVWAVLVAFHYGHAVWKKKSFRDIKLWSSIALLAVQQASYISVTRTLVRIFSCVGASPRKGLFWVEDTSVVCYEGSHAFLVGFVGAPGLLLVSIGFPGWILFKLTRGTKALEQEGSVRRYGFLYQAYKKNVAAWEVVILVRKALLAAIVVFGRTLGEGIQTNLALFVMLGSILLQTHFQPFFETQLNMMELGSLAISTLAFIIGNLVTQPKMSDGGKVAVSAVFIGGVVMYVGYMLVEIFHVVLSELSEWIEKENPGAALPTSTFGLLVVAAKSLTKKAKVVFKEKKVALVKNFFSNSSSDSRV